MYKVALLISMSCVLILSSCAKVPKPADEDKVTIVFYTADFFAEYMIQKLNANTYRWEEYKMYDNVSPNPRFAGELFHKLSGSFLSGPPRRTISFENHGEHSFMFINNTNTNISYINFPTTNEGVSAETYYMCVVNVAPGSDMGVGPTFIPLERGSFFEGYMAISSTLSCIADLRFYMNMFKFKKHDFINYED